MGESQYIHSNNQNHLHQLCYVSHFNAQLPYKLNKKRKLMEHISMCNPLIKCNEYISLLKQIIMVDEKRIIYNVATCAKICKHTKSQSSSKEFDCTCDKSKIKRKMREIVQSIYSDMFKKKSQHFSIFLLVHNHNYNWCLHFYI